MMTLFKQTKTNRPLVLVSIMIGSFIAAIEGTIITTAMPSIAAELGGFSLYSWVFSSYLLIMALTIPIYGKLSDLFGRKHVYTVGTIIFLIGSILCGFAHSMGVLIFYRLIQGVGAGAIQPITTTIIGDIYSLKERGKIQGYLSAVFGFSAIIGPTLGGFLVEYVGWQWVFWINIPIGILSMMGISLFLKENIEYKKSQIDFAGISFMLIFIISIMMVVFNIGTNWSWLSFQVILLVLLAIIAFILFIKQEQRAPVPIIPLWMWRHKLILIANLTVFTSGILMMGVSTYLPTFIQGVLERTPKEAGLVLAMMSFAWPVAAVIAGKAILKTSFKNISIVGGLFLIAGSLLFLFLHQSDGILIGGVGALFIGVGMGLTNTTFIVAIQNSVSWAERGAVTASNIFMRTMGNTLGATLFGALLNFRLASYFDQHRLADNTVIDIDKTNQILDPIERKSIPAEMIDMIKSALTTSLHSVYIVVFLLSIISFVFIMFMSKSNKGKENV